MFPVQIERGKIVQIKGGAIHHDSIIGKLYGSKVCVSNKLISVIIGVGTGEALGACAPPPNFGSLIQILSSAPLLPLTPQSDKMDCRLVEGIKVLFKEPLR